MSQRKNPPWIWWVFLASGVLQLLHWGLQTTAPAAIRWPFFAVGLAFVALSATQLVRARMTRHATSAEKSDK